MRGRTACFIVMLVATAATGSGASRYDWPQWRGHERSAVSQETGLLKHWTPEGPPITWKARGLGGGYSAPAVAGGRIFGMSFRGDDEVVWALDEASGKELWRTRIATAKPPQLPQGSEGTHGTPTVVGGRIFAEGLNAEIVCLDASSGAIRWSKDLAAEFGARMMSGWGFSESPLVDGDRVICTPGGPDAALVALHKDTGDLLWKAKVPGNDKAGYSSPVVAEVEGLRMYVQLMEKGVVGVAAEDGRFLWRYDRMANKVANISTPIVRGNRVFCSTAYRGGSALIRLTHSGDRVEAQEVYFLPHNVFQNHHGGVVLVGDYLYGGHGQNNGAPVCIEFATGKVAWRQEHGFGRRSAAVAYADGRLYFRYEDGTMALIDASPQAFKLEGKFRLPDKSRKESWPHPVIANGKLYIRDQDVLLCFDVKQH